MIRRTVFALIIVVAVLIAVPLLRTSSSTVGTSLPGTAASPVPSGPPREQDFQGNGGQRLGTIALPTDATIHWTNDGALFTVADPTTGIFINSRAASGTSAVTAGTYRNVLVNAVGNWTLQIVPN